ncbi:MAG: chemotaxis response regulator protein-glutamate methylesterase [Gammaproteobacteria bacterium]|nr:MAG: chemotaxis response regulator protein-glutamate methylesterase [Gammaproteobacteria bacterium]
MNKLKVLIVDDSALIRQLLTEILGSDPGIEVVGAAADPYIARDKIKELNPDVLTLDVEMPRMDGISFLRNLMRLRPMPVVMISTLTQQGADTTLEALSLGAIDFVAKPKVDVVEKLSDYSQEIIEKVKVAGKAKVRPLVERAAAKVSAVEQKLSADDVMGKAAWTGKIKTTEKIIAIGASTGGTEAIREVLEQFPADSPAVVITQHIPPTFSESFANRLNNTCAITVVHATDGQPIIPGHAYVAPGGMHLMITRSGARYYCKLSDAAPVNRHKPSVDVMFRSVLQSVGPNAIAAILTGMGDDGAKSMKELRDLGVHTIAQDEKTSVVWGMPGEAVKIGAVEHVESLDNIAKTIGILLKKM